MSSNSTNSGNTPQFRILKRPKDANDSQLNGNARQRKPQLPQKTLAQREEEYAQARLRIMGAAFPEEENNEASTAVRPKDGAAEGGGGEKEEEEAAAKS